MAVRTGASAALLGDREVAAPLHAAGIPVTLICTRTAPARYSRYTSAWLNDPRPDDDALVLALLQHASTSRAPVLLYYQEDHDLLFVSRKRKELSDQLLYVAPDADLVEQLVDKAAFQELAARLDLPVPPARKLRLSATAPGRALETPGLSPPLVVKPLRRDHSWEAIASGKALLVRTRQELSNALTMLRASHSDVLVQQAIPGSEDRIESYHVYVDPAGEVAAAFTGRKLRTLPNRFGHSTALVTTRAEDVACLGREITQKLGLRGVAKLDFKRDPDGRLWLLEVNLRFNLWHRLGAAAGVNIPAIVAADLLGLPRPHTSSARPGVTWCRVERDWLAARQEGVSLIAWLRWLGQCEVRAGLDPGDPMPLLAGKILMPLLATFRHSARMG